MIDKIKNKWLRKDCDSIDSAIFNSDVLLDKESLKIFNQLLIRWKKKADEWKQIQKEIKESKK